MMTTMTEEQRKEILQEIYDYAVYLNNRLRLAKWMGIDFGSIGYLRGWLAEEKRFQKFDYPEEFKEDWTTTLPAHLDYILSSYRTMVSNTKEALLLDNLKESAEVKNIIDEVLFPIISELDPTDKDYQEKVDEFKRQRRYFINDIVEQKRLPRHIDTLPTPEDIGNAKSVKELLTEAVESGKLISPQALEGIRKSIVEYIITNNLSTLSITKDGYRIPTPKPIEEDMSQIKMDDFEPDELDKYIGNEESNKFFKREYKEFIENDFGGTFIDSSSDENNDDKLKWDK